MPCGSSLGNAAEAANHLAGDLIERICRSNRVLAGQVELRGAPSRLTFFSDEGWAERVLGNLVTNALRHARATKVLIGARRRAGDIVFDVLDNGRGLSPRHFARCSRP